MEQKAAFMAKLVATNIRKIREFRNYTQLYMAQRLGISQNAYSKIELGYSKISLDKFFTIALTLDVSCKELLPDGKDDEIVILRDQSNTYDTMHEKSEAS